MPSFHTQYLNTPGEIRAKVELFIAKVLPKLPDQRYQMTGPAAAQYAGSAGLAGCIDLRVSQDSFHVLTNYGMGPYFYLGGVRFCAVNGGDQLHSELFNGINLRPVYAVLNSEAITTLLPLNERQDMEHCRQIWAATGTDFPFTWSLYQPIRELLEIHRVRDNDEDFERIATEQSWHGPLIECVSLLKKQRKFIAS